MKPIPALIVCLTVTAVVWGGYYIGRDLSGAPSLDWEEAHWWWRFWGHAVCLMAGLEFGNWMGALYKRLRR